jgi:hypothetical protein
LVIFLEQATVKKMIANNIMMYKIKRISNLR